MEKNKPSQGYEDFRETATGYAEDKDSHDMLTDPEALASEQDKRRNERAITHGKKLQSIRKEKGFTIEELSEKTGISSTVLTDLEAGGSLLPLGQLIKLSKALNLRMADVIATGEESYSIVRSTERQAFARFGKTKQTAYGYEYESLAPDKKDKTMEPFIVTLQPSVADQPSSHDGQEFIYVIDGQMEAIIENQSYILDPGDTIYYDSTVSHLVRAHGDKPAKILAVISS
jgi:quercetin dioxygenase-like cupin family protein